MNDAERQHLPQTRKRGRSNLIFGSICLLICIGLVVPASILWASLNSPRPIGLLYIAVLISLGLAFGLIGIMLFIEGVGRERRARKP